MIRQETILETQDRSCFRKSPKQRLVAQEGYLYIFLSAVIWIGAWRCLGFFWSLPFFLLPATIASFFRNPERVVPQGAGLIVSPADGKILEITECEEHRYLKSKAKRVSIFMSPFNCHFNRSPVAGKVLDCFYREGSFEAAFKPKAMESNEHHAVLLQDEQGKKWLVVQIAGFLARRIVSYVQAGFALKRGERFGLIQFGSRADLYCPLSCDIFVKAGQRVYAGKTVLGRVA